MSDATAGTEEPTDFWVEIDQVSRRLVIGGELDSETTGALVDAIVRSEQGPWLLDAVHSQENFLRGLTDTGWTIERPFQRMRFGHATMLAGELPFAVAGPEFG